MAGEIIRMGDKTTHGGTVLEGSLFDICMGKPIALIGHKVFCPQCKGAFPIIEGSPFVTFYGKGVALAGMLTGCGAKLIPSQFTDVVEIGSGGNSVDHDDETPARAMVAAETPVDSVSEAVQQQSADANFDDRFLLIDAETGLSIPNTEYAIRRQSGELEFGTTDADGHTHLLSATANAETVDIYV